MLKMLSMFSSKGHELKVVDGYKFNEAYRNSVGQVWRCCYNKCNVLFTTDLEHTQMLIIPNKLHEHECPKNLARQFVSNSTKRKALDAISETF